MIANTMNVPSNTNNKTNNNVNLLLAQLKKNNNNEYYRIVLKNFSQIISDSEFINNNIHELEDIINDIQIAIQLSNIDSCEKSEPYKKEHPKKESAKKESAKKEYAKKELSEEDKKNKEKRFNWVTKMNETYKSSLHDRFKVEDDFSIEMTIADFSDLDFGETYGYAPNKNPGKCYRWDSGPKQSVIWYLLHSRYNIEESSEKKFCFNVNDFEKGSDKINVVISTTMINTPTKPIQKKREHPIVVTPNTILEVMDLVTVNSIINANGESVINGITL
jgi:hypothetical protein